MHREIDHHHLYLFDEKLELFDEKLELSADVFAFAQSTVGQKFRVKVSVAGELWNRTVYLVAGADDLLNDQRGEAGTGGGLDWFLGLQLRFNDEDLKSLLLVGGGAAAGAASKSRGLIQGSPPFTSDEPAMPNDQGPAGT